MTTYKAKRSIEVGELVTPADLEEVVEPVGPPRVELVSGRVITTKAEFAEVMGIREENVPDAFFPPLRIYCGGTPLGVAAEIEQKP